MYFRHQTGQQCFAGPLDRFLAQNHPDNHLEARDNDPDGIEDADDESEGEEELEGIINHQELLHKPGRPAQDQESQHNIQQDDGDDFEAMFVEHPDLQHLPNSPEPERLELPPVLEEDRDIRSGIGGDMKPLSQTLHWDSFFADTLSYMI